MKQKREVVLLWCNRRERETHDKGFSKLINNLMQEYLLFFVFFVRDVYVKTESKSYYKKNGI